MALRRRLVGRGSAHERVEPYRCTAVTLGRSTPARSHLAGDSGAGASLG